MRGAFVAGLFAGMALGALIVMASQEQNRKVIVIQAGRMADMARSMMTTGTNQVVQTATDVAATVVSSVSNMGSDSAEMA